MFVPRGTEFHVSPIYLQVCTYYVSFPLEFRPEFLSLEFQTKLILSWNDLILTCVPTESGNAAKFRGFRKMLPGRYRNKKRNAHPSTHSKLQIFAIPSTYVILHIIEKGQRPIYTLIVHHFRHAVTYISPLLVYTHYVFIFLFFRLLLVYLNLVRLFGSYINLYFCLPPL